jgi:HD-GYP domain-containing protein (c-di-GMP phosphodiesterase class II)
MSRVAAVCSLVDELVVGLLNAQLYGVGHARVVASAREAAARVAGHCEDHRVGSMLVGVVGDQVVFEGRPLLGASLAARRLLQRIRAHGAGGVEFDAHATATDVAAVLALLAKRDETVADVAAANAELEREGVQAVRLVPPYAGGGGGGGTLLVPTATALVSLHQGTVDLLQGLTLSVCQGKDLHLGDVRGAVDEIVSGLSRDAAGMFSISRYEEYDAYTFGHSIRVCLLALSVARACTRDEAFVQRIGTAALLHDVGKALVPFEVLHKRGRLSTDERHEMEKHPVHGAAILLANRESDPLAVSAAYGHHRTVDGNGYPRTRGHYEQSIVTRIVKICDVFEALTAVRPYKPAMSPAKAYRIMLGMPGHFDAPLLRRFMRIIGIHVIGARVRLDDGRVGRVVRQTDDLDRPVVELLEEGGDDSIGMTVEADDAAPRPVVDLTAPGPSDPTRVVGAVTAPTEPHVLTA